jgi:hypothetical protein
MRRENIKMTCFLPRGASLSDEYTLPYWGWIGNDLTYETENVEHAIGTAQTLEMLALDLRMQVSEMLTGRTPTEIRAAKREGRIEVVECALDKFSCDCSRGGLAEEIADYIHQHGLN